MPLSPHDLAERRTPPSHTRGRQRAQRRVSRRIPPQWRDRLAPKLKGVRRGHLGPWTRVRRALWSWWPYATLSLALFAAGVVGWALAAGVVAAINYLITPAEAPPRYGLNHEFDVESDAFLSTMAGATGMSFLAGNRLDVLKNGDAFYPPMIQAIEGAQRSVTIEAYIYWAGDIGLQFAEALSRKAADGVPVKILLDAVGSATIGEEILRVLERGGCQLAWYNPVHWYTIGRFNHRTHRKSLIVDGCVAFTGGAGIADHWVGDAQDPEHWRDTQIRLHGPAVWPLQTGFAHNWLQATGELLSGEAFYPVPDAAGALSALTVLSSPEIGSSAARTLYYLSVTCARRSIQIANPYFIPDEVATSLLIEAHRRGVDVRIMVAGRYNDSALARWNSVRLYGPLLDAGIRIFEYGRTMMHQKIMVVDEVWSTIGTANFDNRSFAHNEESNVCVHDRALAAELRAHFEEDLHASDRVTLDAWRRRGLLTRVREWGASLLEAQV